MDNTDDLEASYNNTTDPEERHFVILRALKLQKRRPSDPSLFCLDYAAAERAAQRGEQGPRKSGGAHLCMQCRGMEIVEDPEHDDDGWREGYGGMWEVSRWSCLGGIGAPTLSMGRNPAFGHASSPSALHNQQKTHLIAIPTTRNVK